MSGSDPSRSGDESIQARSIAGVMPVSAGGRMVCSAISQLGPKYALRSPAPPSMQTTPSASAGYVRRERERDRRAPAVPDHHDRLRMAEPREQPLEIAGDGVEVVAGVGPVALAVAGQVDRDHPMRGDQAVGDQVPPARVARQPVEREQRGLAAGVIAHRERESRRVDAVFGDGVRHATRDCGR